MRRGQRSSGIGILILLLFFLPPLTSGHPFSEWVVSPSFAEVSKSEKFTLQAGGFVSAGGTTESSTSKVTGAAGDFPATVSSTQSSASVVKPGLIQTLTEEAASLEYPFDIEEIYANDSVGGSSLEESTWQQDNDPHFYWTVYGTEEGIAGYSFALDETPDQTLDVKETSFTYAQNNMPDGKHVFRVIAQSTAGKWGREGSFEIWVDSIAPSVLSFSPLNKALLNMATPTIMVDLKDEASGVDPKSIELKINRSKVNAIYDAQQNRITYMPTNPLREGSNSVSFDVADNTRNVTAALVWSFTIDTQPPSGSVVANNGDASTTSTAIKLTLTSEDATTSVKEMMISNQSDFGGGRWEPFITLKDSWTLVPMSGERTVYVKFKDEAGNESAAYSDSIELVIIAPDTTITSGPSGIIVQTTAAFTYSASEPGSSFRHQIDGEVWSEWGTETLVAFTDLKKGNHYFSVKAGKDVDGNGAIDADEEDPTPATRSWTISESGGTEAVNLPPEKPVKYWYKE